MDNPEQQGVPPLEERFAQNHPSRIVKDQRTGQTFTIKQGLPRETYLGKGIFGVPDTTCIYS